MVATETVEPQSIQNVQYSSFNSDRVYNSVHPDLSLEGTVKQNRNPGFASRHSYKYTNVQKGNMNIERHIFTDM